MDRCGRDSLAVPGECVGSVAGDDWRRRRRRRGRRGEEPCRCHGLAAQRRHEPETKLRGRRGRPVPGAAAADRRLRDRCRTGRLRPRSPYHQGLRGCQRHREHRHVARRSHRSIRQGIGPRPALRGLDELRLGCRGRAAEQWTQFPRSHDAVTRCDHRPGPRWRRDLGQRSTRHSQQRDGRWRRLQQSLLRRAAWRPAGPLYVQSRCRRAGGRRGQRRQRRVWTVRIGLRHGPDEVRYQRVQRQRSSLWQGRRARGARPESGRLDRSWLRLQPTAGWVHSRRSGDHSQARQWTQQAVLHVQLRTIARPHHH